MSDATYLAQQFHDTYELLAPLFGYETRRQSAVPWSEVPEPNRSLMIATCEELIARGVVEVFADIPDVEVTP